MIKVNPDDFLLDAHIQRRTPWHECLVDFHLVEEGLRSAVEPYAGRTMNGVPPFDRVHPTAERVAEHVGEQMRGRIPAECTLVSVSVEEAPGCIARWLSPAAST